MSNDPVCGAQVNEHNPGATATYEGQIFYFCCPSCKEQFLKDPQALCRQVEAWHGSRLLWVRSGCVRCG